MGEAAEAMGRHRQVHCFQCNLFMLTGAGHKVCPGKPSILLEAMDEIIVKVRNKTGIELPAYATPEAAGMDVHACKEKDIVIEPMGRQLIPTGLQLEMPAGYECQIRPRSGLALHYGITVLNTPGTVDADSRAEIGVVLINLSDKPFVVHHGDRICQMVFKKCVRVRWSVTEKLDHTKREFDSFGGSGLTAEDLKNDGL